MKKVRLFLAVVSLAFALFAATMFTSSPAAHAQTRSSNISLTCTSNVIPTTNLTGSHVYLRYQSLNYAYTAYFQATQTGYVGGGTFTVGWWIFKGNTLISSQIVQNWNGAASPIYYPYAGLQMGPKIIYGTSPIEFYPGAYNCGGYWWPPQQVTA